MSTFYGKLCLALAFSLAGSSVVAARYVADHLEPYTTTFFSLLFAVAAAAIADGRNMVRARTAMDGRRWRLFFWQALFGIFLFRVFLTHGLNHTSAAEAGIITGSGPAITALLVFFLLREKLHERHVLGIAFTVCGILLLQNASPSVTSGDGQNSHLRGNLLILGAAACESLFSIFSRKAYAASGDSEIQVKPVTHAGLVSGFALLLCLVPMLLENPLPALATLPLCGWLALLWYGVMVTIIAFVCMFEGARRCDGYTMSAFTGFLPLSALVLSFAILGNSVGTRQWLGCLCVVASILVISKRGAHAPTQSEHAHR